MSKFAKAYSAAKMDHAEASHYCRKASRYARRAAKRDLTRAARRYGKTLCNA